MKATKLTWEVLSSEWNESLEQFASEALGNVRIAFEPVQALKDLLPPGRQSSTSALKELYNAYVRCDAILTRPVEHKLDLERNGDRAYVRVMYRRVLYRRDRTARIRANETGLRQQNLTPA